MKNLTTSFIGLIIFVGFLFANVACDKSEDLDVDDQSAGTIKDADGNVYKTIKIGSQVWMVENLKTTKYNDGTEIQNITNQAQWEKLTTGAYCNYDNLESNATIYGRLYNWYAVNTGKLAPSGWHVPDDEDWTILENYLIANGYSYSGKKDDDEIAKALASTNGWSLSDITGTPGAYPEGNNHTGFTALPGGYRNFGGFKGIGSYCDWWSSKEYSSIFAWYRQMKFDLYDLHKGGDYKVFGFSVRCVRDN